MRFQFAHNVPIPTTPVEHPFRVKLEGGPSGSGDVVTVHDEAIIDGLRIVRSAFGDGFWYLAKVPVIATSRSGTDHPIAIFEPHTSASFKFAPH